MSQSLAWAPRPEPKNLEEEVLLHPLLDLMWRRGWLNADSHLRVELAWNGRRIDVATCTKTGITSAYELKLGSFQRVLEQAMYNRLSFDKSWIVVAGTPNPSSSLQAIENGIGIIIWDGSTMRVAAPARRQASNPRIKARLRMAFNRGGK